MKITKLLLLVGALAGFGLVARAQSGNEPVPHSTSGSTPDSGSHNWKNSKGDAYASSSMNKGMHICLADELLGKSVVSPQGDKLGKIEDVVIHPGGEVAYAVLSFGGFLGMGDKYFAIPWSSFKHEHEGAMHNPEDKTTGTEKSTTGMREKKSEPLVLSIDKERLKNAPGFDKSHWPEMANTDWAKDVDNYYGTTANAHRSDTGRPVEASSARGSAMIWKLTDLKGVDVKAPDDTKLGDIKDVAIDTNGRVCCVVLSADSRRVLVPWQALSFTHDTDKDKSVKRATLDMTKDRLAQAPALSKDKDNEAVEACDPAVINRSYSFFSVKPYWNESDMGTHHSDMDDTKPHHDSDKQPPK
jgi:sporulation protein YlmC with PRC-barrel domain